MFTGSNAVERWGRGTRFEQFLSTMVPLMTVESLTGIPTPCMRDSSRSFPIQSSVYSCSLRLPFGVDVKPLELSVGDGCLFWIHQTFLDCQKCQSTLFQDSTLLRFERVEFFLLWGILQLGTRFPSAFHAYFLGTFISNRLFGPTIYRQGAPQPEGWGGR